MPGHSRSADRVPREPRAPRGVDVNGVTRLINIGLLEDEGLQIGDWVLIHVGFAMAKIDEDEARRAFEGLQLMGRAYDDELLAMDESPVITIEPVIS